MDHRQGSRDAVDVGRRNPNRKRICALLLVFLLCALPYSIQAQSVSQSHTVTVTAIVPAASSGGTPPPPAGGGGGSNSPAAPAPSITATGNQVVFKGLAYPGSIVTLLRDGRVVTEVPASPDASFQILLSGIQPGTYNFGIRAQDTEGRLSSMQTYSIVVTSGVTAVVQGIFLAPTISIDKTTVRKGDVLTILGRSVPSATVTVIVHSANAVVENLSADTLGGWAYKLNTQSLEEGNHQVKAQGTTATDFTPFSPSLSFTVGTDTKLQPTADVAGHDLNGDGRINIQDFSVMAYWYNRPNPPAKVDFNGDAQVNLVDLSILAYYWTG